MCVAASCLQLDSRGRLFGVSFAGEDGLDWGGLYRDAITLMVEDCFSARLNLCLVCPNGTNQQGTNMDKYLPNPKHVSPRILKMFEFLGKLVGVSMRQKLYLPFAFPSIVWKQLVGEPVTLDDVCQVDEACAVQLTDMKDMARLGSRADFESKYGAAVFVISGSDGQSVELLPGGATLRVTWDTRDQFVRLAESFKIHEFDAQVMSLEVNLY
jgi:E3 ubiquitin-protein ligase HERC2